MSAANDERTVDRTTITERDGEYRVKAWDGNGVRWPEADYFTNDRSDAEDTALSMMRA